MSRAFAATLVSTLRTNNPPIKVHDAGDPIRNVIRQSGGRAYVPAVLRNNLIPTKVLVEVANMTNPTDQKHLADPKWRQWFAEAFVDALRNHYGN
jgi:N-acetylmuramoyl-L-alanine amidase